MDLTKKIYLIFGGSFNPIHLGHIKIILDIRDRFYFDKLILVPNANPPHKAEMLSFEHRFNMLKFLADKYDFIEISDIESDESITNYTYNTQRKIKEIYGKDNDYYFIIGEDSLYNLGNWYNFVNLIKELKFLVVPRNDIKNESKKSHNSTSENVNLAIHFEIERLNAKHHSNIRLLDIHTLNISSSHIRAEVNAGRTTNFLVLDEVGKYIEENQLYINHHPDYSRLYKILKSRLSEYRFNHSVEVSKIARKYAVHYGPYLCPDDCYKAELAGLMHDYAKEIMNENSLSYIDKYQIYKDPAVIANPNLAHGEIAAGLLREEGLITDEAILNAIRWHTYGTRGTCRAENSEGSTARIPLLTKIVYLADCLEPTRDYEGAEELRRLAYIDINLAVLRFLELQEAWFKTKNSMIHGNMTEFKNAIYEDYINKRF